LELTRFRGRARIALGCGTSETPESLGRLPAVPAPRLGRHGAGGDPHRRTPL